MRVLETFMHNPTLRAYSFVLYFLRWGGWYLLLLLDYFWIIDALGQCYYEVTPFANSRHDIVSRWMQCQKRNNNEFLLTLFSQRGNIAEFMEYHLAHSNDFEEWLAHTNLIISKFLEQNRHAVKHELNFWGSTYIAQTHPRTGKQALDWIERMYVL